MTRQDRWTNQKSKERRKWLRKGAKAAKEQAKNLHVAPKSWVLARQGSMAATRKGDQKEIKKTRRKTRREKNEGELGVGIGSGGDGEEMEEEDGDGLEKMDEDEDHGMNKDEGEAIDDDLGVVTANKVRMEGEAADEGMMWKDECVLRFKNN